MVHGSLPINSGSSFRGSVLVDGGRYYGERGERKMFSSVKHSVRTLGEFSVTG